MARISKPGISAAVTDYCRAVFPSIQVTARAYKVAESSVRQSYRCRPTRQQDHTHKRLLTPIQEKMLVGWSIDPETCA